jgi:hypothetical protein
VRGLRLTLLTVVLLLGCNGDKGDDDDDAGEDDGDDGGGDCLGTHFSSTPEDWALPSGFPEDTFLMLASPTADPAWTLLDLSGDGAVDIVLTRRDDIGIDALGQTQWLVYENTGDGFASTPTEWALPSGFPADTFIATGTSEPDPYWQLMDLNGDGAVDLVVTRRDELGLDELGNTRWLVYENTGSGFADAPNQWALPQGFPDDEFVLPAAPASDPYWSLLELDGDGATDLVVLRRDEIGVDELGDTKWLIHANSGEGFEESPSDWSMPSSFPEDEFRALYPPNSDLLWSLLDLNIDGATDLVVTRRDELGVDALGSTKWLLYANEGAGMAEAPADFALPPGFPAEEFLTLAFTSEDLVWSLLDLQGDGGADLMVARRDALEIDALGTSKWLLYENDGSGMASEPVDFGLPSGFSAGTFEAFGATEADFHWALLDLDGDGRSDLVVTRRDEVGVAELGQSKWVLYRNLCD